MKLKVAFLVMLFALIACGQEERKPEKVPVVSQVVISPSPVSQGVEISGVETPKEKNVKIKPVDDSLDVVQKEEPQLEAISVKEEVLDVASVIIPENKPVEVPVKEVAAPSESMTAKPVAAPEAIVEFPVTQLIVLGDAIKGKKVAKKCAGCHTFNEGGKKKTGPNLFGIAGGSKGTSVGFKYGSYLKDVGGVWDEVSLRAWVVDSKAVAKAAGKKSKMSAQKITGTKADDLIAYLKTLK